MIKEIFVTLASTTDAQVTKQQQWIAIYFKPRFREQF